MAKLWIYRYSADHMEQNSPVKKVLEGLALFMVIAFPAWGIFWAITTQGGTVSQSAPMASAGSSSTSGTPPQAMLALESPQSLPQYISAGQVVPFSFSMTNTGSIAGTYAYKVYVVWNNGEQDVIDLNSTTLSPGASTRIPESLKFETASAAGTIHIEIVSPQKSLQFSLPRR